MASDSFVPILTDSELKEGQIIRVQISGRSILLIMKGGKVFGLSNSCPHMGCSIDKGILREYLVMCPCHGWKFDIRNGQYEENSAITLVSYRCKIQNGKVYVEIPAEA